MRASLLQITGAFVPAAVEDWNRGQNKLTVRLDANSGSCFHHCSQVADLSANGDPYQFGSGCTGNLVLTTVSPTDGHIDYAFTYVNKSCEASGNDYQRRTIVCHEIGHLFRMQHQGDSCMRGNVPPYNNTPNSHDKGALENVYGHGF